MRAVKSKGAKSTEKRLRASLVASGIAGWTMHADALPGKPDFVFPVEKLAVFADGCFWHGCPNCYRRPHSRNDYWDSKVTGNMRRDRRNKILLQRDGWRVVRFWEHEIKSDLAKVIRKIKTARRERSAKKRRTIDTPYMA